MLSERYITVSRLRVNLKIVSQVLTNDLWDMVGCNIQMRGRTIEFLLM